jgi:hypothetical protein
MAVPAPTWPTTKIAGLILGLATIAAPLQAAHAPQARLVHCGGETCLRISGHRQGPAVAIRIDGRDLAVDGGRTWQITVPLAMARAWAAPSGGALTVTLVDTQGGTESTETAVLPPGALGRRVELASLVVRAR